MSTLDSSSPHHYFHHLDTSRLDQLMPHRIRHVLLISSLYNYFILEEDGCVSELLSVSYSRWNLGYIPKISRVNNASEAVQALQQEKYDLVLTMMRPRDLDLIEFSNSLRQLHIDIPVITIAYDHTELQLLFNSGAALYVNKIFMWYGDGNLIIGIIQYIEDMINARHDMETAGTQNLIIVEDSVEFYSLYLPIIFEELRNHTFRLLHKNLTFSQKILRQQARPKVHLATTYEEAYSIYTKFKHNLLGIITDLEFPMGNNTSRDAGLCFIKKIKEDLPYLPVLLQSSDPDAAEIAHDYGTHFIPKNSITLRNSFRDSLEKHFGFGDIIFYDNNDLILHRASNLTEFTSVIKTIPEDLLLQALINGSVSRWLRARTNFELAETIDALDLNQCCGSGILNHTITTAIHNFRYNILRGSMVPYSSHFHEEYSQFSFIGNGSIGGKARGLEFFDKVLFRDTKITHLNDVSISIPRSLILRTGVYDEFIDMNLLFDFAMNENDDSLIEKKFIESHLPPSILGDLRNYIVHTTVPIAVRSSSLLEDSLYQPFSGIYTTHMLPNNNESTDRRFIDFLNAIKRIYASVFFQKAKRYMQNTSKSIEDEKMAILIQEITGQAHESRFYPDFSGTARSMNFYPFGNIHPDDGIAEIALGLGKTISEGGLSLQFSPEHPGVLPQYNSIEDMIEYSQKKFYALSLDYKNVIPGTHEKEHLVLHEIGTAESDGVLQYTASTYSCDNDMVYDGITIPGPRIINFAHILKNEVFPLSEILKFLLSTGAEAMGCPVEIEFAVLLHTGATQNPEFSILQIRPMTLNDQIISSRFNNTSVADTENFLCSCPMVMGNGIHRNIQDIIYVPPFEITAPASNVIARDLEKLNAGLVKAERPYILIGPGRWGTTEPWLGIPVKWNQICNASVIIELRTAGMNIDFSKGSHFFHNISSKRVGYFSVATEESKCFLDLPWLNSLPTISSNEYIRHIRLIEPLEIIIDGRTGMGIISKKVTAI
ncbi:MAG TPA: PEP/pyruvate-binding domain-containing protein [Spirochaetota bacterium]|mgnify:FL=1|nr:PEP/pyruvate-binding domain-containing protein [Spirochaetota bacterium]